MEELKSAQTVIDEQQAKDLLGAITKIPDLGMWGIVAAIALIILLVLVWYWWNNIHQKQVNAENEKKRAEDQAKTVTENQDASQEWKQGSDAVDDARKEEPDSGKQPRPKPPTS